MERDKDLLTLLNSVEKRKMSAKTHKVVSTARNVKSNSMAYSTVKSNNWMNIRYSKNQTWLGEVSHEGGFVIFEKPEYSVRAFYKVLNSYAKQKVTTLSDIANKYAPKKDGNHPEVYINLVIKMGKENDQELTANSEIEKDLYPLMAKAFLQIESGIEKDLDWFSNLYKLYM